MLKISKPPEKADLAQTLKKWGIFCAVYVAFQFMLTFQMSPIQIALSYFARTCQEDTASHSNAYFMTCPKWAQHISILW